MLSNWQEFKGTVDDFIDQITVKRKGFLKKKKAQSYYELWWEDEEKWFMNIRRVWRDDPNSSFIIRKDLRSTLEFKLEQGYILYIQSE